MVIAILAVICATDNWQEVAQFARAKRKWLKTPRDKLPHGIPSHDTFGRVFAAIQPEAFERCFAAWIQTLAKVRTGELIALDGKTLRRSFDRTSDKAAIHRVSAWSSANGLVFAQIATEAKSNEITAIPRLLELLDLRGRDLKKQSHGKSSRAHTEPPPFQVAAPISLGAKGCRCAATPVCLAKT